MSEFEILPQVLLFSNKLYTELVAQDCQLSTGAAYGRNVTASLIPALGKETQYSLIYSVQKKKKYLGWY